MYQLWHKYDIVLEVKGSDVVVHNQHLLPFDLKQYKEVTLNEFLQYMTRRIGNSRRAYMAPLYKQRRVSTSEEMIRDSGAISLVDLFWITKEEIHHTWDFLQTMRDDSMTLARVTLDGTLDKETLFKPITNHTSIYTAKGAFPKAVYDGFLLKKGSNAEYEVYASAIGNYLGIDVAKAEKRPDNVIACNLFINENTSLVHAGEYLYTFSKNLGHNIYEDSLDRFKNNPDITKQLQRLFLFNYLISNFDLHGENFGFLYDTTKFEILSVAPSYDFNAAFEAWGNVKAYDPFILANLQEFLENNQDIIHKLETIDYILDKETKLTNEQKKEIGDRADYLISISL